MNRFDPEPEGRGFFAGNGLSETSHTTRYRVLILVTIAVVILLVITAAVDGWNDRQAEQRRNAGPQPTVAPAPQEPTASARPLRATSPPVVLVSAEPNMTARPS